MKNIKVIKSYSSFNRRRYSNPWVAIIDQETGDPDFKNKIGGYTGAFGKGEEGDLYIIDPQEGVVYTYGQKDYRGGNTERGYLIYKDGEFVEISSKDVIFIIASK